MYSKEIIERAQRAGCKWIATDSDGEAWGYMMRPESYIDAWRKDPFDKSVLFQLSIANPAGCSNWRDTLYAIDTEKVKADAEISALYKLAEDAPRWAEWIAIDDDGNTRAYGARPVYADGKWQKVSDEGGYMPKHVGNVDVGVLVLNLFHILRLGGAVSLNPVGWRAPEGEAPRDWADAEPLAIADLPPGSKTLYLDVMQRLARAVESGKLPADTFAILWGE